jgi:hypothetical protein
LRPSHLLAARSTLEKYEHGERKGRAIDALHRHTLSSFKKWAVDMQGLEDPYLRGDPNGEGTQQQKLFEVTLWWCVWGEAGNMRFMPEFLAWVVHALLQKRDTDQAILVLGKYEEGGGVLRRIMRPMYEYISAEAFKKDEAGNNVDHASKKNLDDINEYFWMRSGKAACTKFDVFTDKDEDPRHVKDGQPCEGVNHLIEQLRKEKKTYVERRGLLHSVKSNMRVFTVYLVLFQLIVTVAYHVPFEQTTLPLCPPQLPSDSCLSANSEKECVDQRVGCEWGKRVPADNPFGEPTDQCFDTCTHTTTKETCDTVGEGGCVWDKEAEECHMYSSKAPEAILKNIDQTTYISCDLNSALCRYKDNKGTPITYSCLEHLDTHQAKLYLSYNTNFAYFENWPGIGRLLKKPDPEGSDLSWGRANQTRMFDALWRGDDDSWKRKRDLLNKLKNSFTCGFDIDTPKGLAKAGSISDCCTVNLTRPDEQNHGFVSVWSATNSCQWNLLDLFEPEYSGALLNLERAVVTLVLLRLIGELLGLICLFGSSHMPVECGQLCNCRRWPFIITKLATILAYMVLLLAMLGITAGVDYESLSSFAEQRRLTAFECLCVVALIPDVVVGLQLALRIMLEVQYYLAWCIFKTCGVACCEPQRVKDNCLANCSMRGALGWWCHKCTPRYARKIKGQMGSAFGTSVVYSLIWVALLFFKVYFSYYYEIRLQMQNMGTTWVAIATPFARKEFDSMGNYWDKLLLDSVRSTEGGVHVAEVVIVLTWIPTLVVFIMDSQIFFAFVQMIVGMVHGIWLKVGHVNTWADFQQKLVEKLFPKFANKLDAGQFITGTSGGPDPRASAPHLSGRNPSKKWSGGAPLLSDTNPRNEHSSAQPTSNSARETEETAWEFRMSRSFKRFVECWNMFIDKLRYDDYLSDCEASLYQCISITLDGNDDEPPLLPPMLTLDGIGKLLDEVDQLEDKQTRFWFARKNYSDAKSDKKKKRTKEHWKNLTANFIRPFNTKEPQTAEIREAVSGASVLTLHLLRRLSTKCAHQEAVRKIESWLKSLSSKNLNCDSPILKKMLKDPARGSAKADRTQLLNAIAAFAESLVSLCIPEDGKSKQCSMLFTAEESFQRTNDQPKMNANTVAAVQKRTNALLALLQEICEGDGGHLRKSTDDDPSAFKTLLELDELKECSEPEAARRKAWEDQKHTSEDEKKKEETRRGDILLERCGEHFENLSRDTSLRSAAMYLVHLCKTSRADAEPVSGEARRRILTFASSLHMEMPKPKTVDAMKSMTAFTPYYNETALYTRDDIMEEKDGQASILTYLQTVHPDQWSNLTERLGITNEVKDAGNTVPEWVWEDEGMATEVRLWASLRGQTLARTVHGVMQNEEALRLFARQEEHLSRDLKGTHRDEDAAKPPEGAVWKSEPSWERQAHLKYGYVVSCQIYGSWDENNELKKGIDILMKAFPHLRIAYVNEEDDPQWRRIGVAVNFKNLEGEVKEELETRAPEDQKGEIVGHRGEGTAEERVYKVKVEGLKDVGYGPSIVSLKGSQLTAANAEDKKYYSYLVRWSRRQNKVVKCYRIEQPCNRGGKGNWGPAWLVGEGKPENQNHAIVFTRGQYLQTLDMNQDGYFEEALKTRNLLEEFADADCPDQQQLRIIGFPEHQFSDTLSAVAEFSALTEFTFATLIQRTLGSPFDVRMHYGHPDIFDRVFHVTRGGISKPMKTLCVSEDIFGAFNSVLKGGAVKYFEYIKQGKGKDLGFGACSLFEQKISSGNGEQALSRDYSRLCEQMSITRLLSFFHSSNGFYWSNIFVIWATSWFIYSQILISVVIPDEQRAALLTVTESVTFAFQLGLVLTVPLVAELILEKGPKAAIVQMIRVLCRGGPFFFMFHIRTKAYYYDRTLVLGGAGYKATGRGFVLKKEGFVELFSMFHYSHLNYGATLVMNLLVYRFFIVSPESYGSVTWATWLFAVDLLFAPFIFNCLALDRKSVETDIVKFSKFLWRDSAETQKKNRGEAAKESWRAYFVSENAGYQTIDLWTRLSLIARDLIWIVIPLAILLERNASATENVEGHFWRAVGVALGTVLTGVLSTLAVLGILAMILYSVYRNSDCVRKCVDPISTCINDECCGINYSKKSSCFCCRCFTFCSDETAEPTRCRKLLAFCEMFLTCYCFRARKAKRFALMVIFLLCLWIFVTLFTDYGQPLEVVSIYVASLGYLVSFVTNAVFYMGYRPEWMFLVYWVHDATLGYAILAPFYVLSVFQVIGDAHMFLLYNSKFVEVLNTKSFNSEVMGVVERNTKITKRVAPRPEVKMRAKSQSFRMSQVAAAIGNDSDIMEPEPETEVRMSRPASPG